MFISAWPDVWQESLNKEREREEEVILFVLYLKLYSHYSLSLFRLSEHYININPTVCVYHYLKTECSILSCQWLFILIWYH